MKTVVYSVTGAKKGEINLASAFSKPVREDIIKKAVLSERNDDRQAYGANKTAGMRTSAHYHGRRGIRHSMMNREMARMKRIHDASFLGFAARIVPQATKGRKAHPPKSEKNWEQKVNKKEKTAALYSAISACSNKEIVKKRGHKIKEVNELPLVIESKIESLKKTKDIKNLLEKIGLKNELSRCREKKVRPGKGTRRGRKYTRKKGPIIIVKDDKGILKAGRNIAGIDVVSLKKLRVQDLAPGGDPGRICIWSEDATKEIK
ncbi:MAG: 50S ribosomal protein L4 [Candidatus Aenigmarchaeota archaeon]|nr:50S ribosomal protein L4 [Candidatus Aenigmarchaeota archaeon]